MRVSGCINEEPQVSSQVSACCMGNNTAVKSVHAVWGTILLHGEQYCCEVSACCVGNNTAVRSVYTVGNNTAAQ